jgi:hypothetical protein
MNIITNEQFAELGFEPKLESTNSYERVVKTKHGEYKYQLVSVSESTSFNFHVYEPENPTKKYAIFIGQEVFNFDELKYLLNRCVGYKYWLSQEI